MTTAAPALDAIGLSDLDLERIGDFAARLTKFQALWVSGYFAGLAQAGEQTLAPAPAARTESITILYGSETGNAAALARQFAARAAALGLRADVQDMASYKVQKLKDETWLLVITSTHGEGEPPESARGFFEFLSSRKAPKLAGLHYAVLGLGDSTYTHFCQAARDLDRQLAMLGATRFHSRVDCDVDYDEPATAWRDAVLDKVKADCETRHGGARPTGTIASAPSPAPTPEPRRAPQHDKTNPFLAPVIENLRITGRGSSKEIRHIELALDGSGLSYQPGDALGIIPRNDPALVEALLAALGLSDSDPVSVGGASLPIGRALQERFEITALTPRFLTGWSEWSGSDALKRLLDEGEQAALAQFLKAHHIIDVVKAYPVANMEPAAFVAILRKLQPRLYSIASSQAATPDEAHVTVATVRYALHGTSRTGVASGWLAERVRPDDTIPVYIQANDKFRLPSDPARPIIMIGAGTGIAPYRAFMQERAERGVKAPAWLFFGERQFRSDFLYQTEWQGWLKSGVLGRIDLAFSRDQAGKVYVQHRMTERARDLYAWLDDGAHLYVCGDAVAMAPDVDAALLDIVERQAACSREQAVDYVRALQSAGRYHRDVY